MIGNDGDKIDSLAAFRQKPPNGGSPARFIRRRADAPSWDGDIADNVGIVFGELVRVIVKMRRSGRVIMI